MAVAGALGRWKIIRHDGSIHATLDDYDTVKPLSEGVAAVRRGELWGFVDSGGNTLAAPQFQLAGSMREGLAVVKKEGRYGYVDRRGRLAIEAIYDYAVSFRNGRATVSSGGESYEIGPRGERI